jgi:hypothetical protein
MIEIFANKGGNYRKFYPIKTIFYNDKIDMNIWLPTKSSFNPHARATQNYSILEDLAQAPSMMSALEVLQSCPTQRKALLKAIGGIDPTNTNLIIFDLQDHIPRLPLLK